MALAEETLIFASSQGLLFLPIYKGSFIKLLTIVSYEYLVATTIYLLD